VDIGVTVGEQVDLPGYGQRRHRPPVIGREAIARIAMQHSGPCSSITLLSLPGVGKPTVVGLHDGRVVIFATLTVRDGRITQADAVLDPNKLADLNLVLDPDPGSEFARGHVLLANSQLSSPSTSTSRPGPPNSGSRRGWVS
jgi:hypothetical protein